MDWFKPSDEMSMKCNYIGKMADLVTNGATCVSYRDPFICYPYRVALQQYYILKYGSRCHRGTSCTNYARRYTVNDSWWQTDWDCDACFPQGCEGLTSGTFMSYLCDKCYCCSIPSSSSTPPNEVDISNPLSLLLLRNSLSDTCKAIVSCKLPIGMCSCMSKICSGEYKVELKCFPDTHADCKNGVTELHPMSWTLSS